MMLVEFDHVLERKIASDIRIEDEKWLRIFSKNISEPPVTGFIIPYTFPPPKLDVTKGLKRQYFIIERFGKVYLLLQIYVHKGCFQLLHCGLGIIGVPGPAGLEEPAGPP
jgi:hypothetical protein